MKVDWDSGKDGRQRWVKRRSQYLARTTKMDATDAEIVAYSELGYSSIGIAERVGLGEATIKKHLQDIAKTEGEAAIYALSSSQISLQSQPGGVADE